jgi:hypothetical protein
MQTLTKIICNWLLLVILTCTLAPNISAQTPGTPQYPTSLDTQNTLLDVSNNASSNLTAGINNSVTTIAVGSTAAFAATGAISIDAEIILYTGKTGTTFTGCTRGVFGTTAASHSGGAPVRQNILAQHFTARGTAIIAVQTKLGTGSSTPTTGTVLQGTGTGASAWQQLTGTPAVDFNLGNGTAAANTFRILVSNAGSKPGLRYNGTVWEFSNDGTNWSQITSGGGSLGGSGQTNQFAYWTNALTLAAAPLTLVGTTVQTTNQFRVVEQMAVGVNNGPSSLVGITNTHDFGGDGQGIYNLIGLNGGAGSHTGGAGIYSQFTNQSVGNQTGTLIGADLRGQHIGAGTFNDLIGVRAYVAHPGGSGNGTRAIGVQGWIQQGGTTSEIHGFMTTGTIAGTAPIVNLMNLANPTTTSATITTFTGLLVDNADNVTATTKRAAHFKGGNIRYEETYFDIFTRTNAPAVSAAGSVRIWYNGTKLRCSYNGGAYADCF